MAVSRKAAGARRVTIKDVAARAGVADMTVSRVVNGNGPTSDEVARRVRAAINELGYIPSRIARGLRSSRTQTLALIVPDVTNPFFTTVARGVEDAASDRDHLVLLCNTDESEQEELRYLEMLASQGVDGVLLAPAQSGAAAHKLAVRNGVKLVIVDRRPILSDVSVVRCDSHRGAAEMARYLLGLGHRNFCILAGPEGVPTSQDRVSGFLGPLREHGFEANVLHGRFSNRWGAEGAGEAMKAHPRPTAIFALNNFVAIGAQQRLQSLGIDIPGRVTLVGFDDLPATMVAQPFLTVVAQPAYQMGKQAVELLLDELLIPGSPREIVLPTKLVIRGSSGPPPT